MKGTFALVCGATVAFSGSTCGAQGDVHETRQFQWEMTASERTGPDRIVDPSALRITVKEAVAEAGSEAFLRRISALLGTELWMPGGLPRSARTLPAGEWSAAEILEWLSQKLMKSRGIQGRWRKVFVLTPASKDKPAGSILPSAGNVTVTAHNRTFYDVAYMIAKCAGGDMEMARSVPGPFSARFRNVPAEEAMEELAARAGLIVSYRMYFRFDREMDGPGVILEDEAEMAEAEEASQDTLVELQLISDIASAIGIDPMSPTFPWAAVNPLFWTRLGFSPQGLSAFKDRMSERIQNRALTHAFSRELLSGKYNLGNFDPITGDFNDRGYCVRRDQ